MATLNVNGETLNCLRAGAGPALLFIHSLGADATMWRRQFAAFAQRYDCIAFDCRGHGASTCNGEFSVDAVAADLAHGLAALGVERCHMVGLSMGGPIALAFNAAHAGAVRSLTIADSFVDLRAGAKDRLYATQEALAYMSMRDFGLQYANDRLLGTTPMEEIDALAQAVAKLAPKTYLATLGAIMTIDFAPLLAKVKAPSLVLVGDKDRSTPIAHAQAIAAGINGAKLEVIVAAGHIANLDNPDGFNAALGAFLDAQPR